MFGRIRAALRPTADDDRGGDAGQPSLPSLDETLTLLANYRRRRALYHLTRLDQGAGVEMDTLSRSIAVDEVAYATAPADVHGDDKKAVYVALHQHHIPDLADADLVERERQTIHITERGREAAALVDDLRDHWGEH